MRTIYINGKFLCQQVTGTQRYAREIVHYLDRLLSSQDSGMVFEILVPTRATLLPQYQNISIRRVGSFDGVKWEQLELPWYCRGELLLTLSGGAPLLHTRNVITIHDAAVFAAPAGYSAAYRLWYRMLYRKMARRAEHILTVSKFSRSELVKWCNAQEDRITVIYPGSDHFASIEADSSTLQRFGISGKFILAASSLNANKNFHRLVQAFHSLNTPGLQLVAAGGSNNRVFGAHAQLPEDVRTLGYVTDSELKALFQNAACFVFPSLYEGFGLPPLEALSSGCPIVVSDRASLPEIFGHVAFVCNPEKVEDIAAAILKTLSQPPASSAELKAFARTFNWQKSAQQTLEILASLP